MKKLALALAFLMIIPGAAFGLEMMNDSSLDDVSGQAGVSIALDDLQIFMNIERIAWIDCDGYECDSSATSDAPGAVGISNFQLDVLNINAPDSATVATTTGDGTVWDLENANPCNKIDLFFDYGSTATGQSCSIATGYDTVDLSGLSSLGTQTLGLNNYTPTNPVDSYVPAALTIDATSQLPVLSFAKNSAYALASHYDNNGDDTINVGGVLIGVPTLEIYIPSLTMTPAFYNVEGTDYVEADNDYGNANYGTIALEGVTMTTLSGWIEIAPH